MHNMITVWGGILPPPPPTSLYFSFTSTNAFMLNKCLILMTAYRILFTLHPTVSSQRNYAMHHVPPTFYF